ncbi:MAG: polynucleotide adenylyltransferase PcnB [Chlamydiia bacterium]|nr:polynucleotide adenylyltransferase PcnB [Chlamydiia bacterium]
MLPQIFLADEHEINPDHIDADALSVIGRLIDAGFQAYLVGGSVRDLLANKTPKDFDVSTSATPEEVKRLFGKQCLIIGKRFRLAHVRFGRKIIEVATFRRGDSNEQLIVRDNVWGTPEEDVMRRDFTINGLFLDPVEHKVIDYVGGWEDIHKGLLRTIGDPVVRFRQDPVRMLRLIKFQARFDFLIDPESEKALQTCRDEIIKSSSARVLEEFLRMLESGASAAFFYRLKQHTILDIVLPWLSHFIDRHGGTEIYRYLEAVDELHRTRPNRLLRRSVLVAALIYPVLLEEIKSQLLNRKQTPHIGNIQHVVDGLLDAITHTPFSHFPKKMGSDLFYLLTQQFRFTPLVSRLASKKVAVTEEFELALSFLKVRSLVNPQVLPVYEQWKEQYIKQRELKGRPPRSVKANRES